MHMPAMLALLMLTAARLSVQCVRLDLKARIRAAGGRVVVKGGASRVNGFLAMSRSIGDHHLRPFVIAEPEVSCVERCADDEVLIIATDGLWDVFSCTVRGRACEPCPALDVLRACPSALSFSSGPYPALELAF